MSTHDHSSWLTSTWPFVRSQLPDAPATVVEIGCGELGGFVPMLRQDGYDAVGVDPEAPDGSEYHQTEFEQYDVERPVDAIVASASLHHVADLGDVLARVSAALVEGGVLVIVEWEWERFDEPTARWCFARLPAEPDESHPGWLSHHQAGWSASQQLWDDYLSGWAREECLHTGEAMLTELDARFERRVFERRPYFFADLADTSEADEQDAIDAGEIQAACLRTSWIRRSGHENPKR